MNSPIADEIAAALDWWHDAGIDYVFRDEPRQWLAAAAPTIAAEPEQRADMGPAAAAARQAAAPAPAPRDRADWPTDLAAFAGWWLSEPWLDAGRTQGRVAPRGPARARLMVIVPQPETEDGETLLSGPQGKLVSAMLTAMGVAPGETYIASALCRHTPAADWNENRARGLDEVLLHHVALVGPERVIAFGDTIPSLLGHDPTNSAAPPNQIAVGRRTVPLLPLRSLDVLLTRPGMKADAWRRWLAWTA